jgi:hypothetical protein
VGSNGVAISGLASGFIDFVNTSIGLAGTVPSGLPEGGSGYLLPFWDDLQPQADAGSTTIYWQETGGVLYILWKDIGHFVSAPGQSITFEIQVFSNPAGCGAFAQFLYPDTVFGGSQAGFDQGGSATIGYNGGGTLNPNNLQWSFNGSFLVPSGTVVTTKFPASSLTSSSPFGPGSLQLNYGASACFLPGVSSSWVLAVTLNAGNYPNGWLFGVDIPLGELLTEISYGPPYVGSGNTFTLGPFAGLPSALDIFAVVLGFNSEGVFAHHSNSIAYTIP